MACGGMSDTELRDRLRELGVSAGPITDSTRSLYQHKLWNLTQNSGSTKTKVQHPKTLPKASSDGPDGSCTRTPRSVAAARARSTRPRSPTCDTSTAADCDHKVDHASSPSPTQPLTNEAISSPTTLLSPQMIAGNMGKFLKKKFFSRECVLQVLYVTDSYPDLLFVYFLPISSSFCG